MEGDTVTDISALSGRKLDAAVATEVMGLPALKLKDAPCPYCGSDMRFCGERSWCSPCHEWRHSPYKEYSEEIEAAWAAAERIMGATGFTVLQIPGMAEAEIVILANMEGTQKYGQYRANAETAALALCRVALMARRALG